MNHEKPKRYPEHAKKPNYPLRRKFAAGTLAVVGAATLFGGGKLVSAMNAKDLPNASEKIAKKWDVNAQKEVAKKWDGFVDRKADTVTIYPGAHLRTDPVDTDDDTGTTNLETTTDKKIVVPVDGVVINQDINGDWITLAAQAVKNADPDLDIDGTTVSVNTQRASVHDEGSTSVANQ
jgi:hypothetical protein